MPPQGCTNLVDEVVDELGLRVVNGGGELGLHLTHDPQDIWPQHSSRDVATYASQR
jgi:hypothetical protein